MSEYVVGKIEFSPVQVHALRHKFIMDESDILAQAKHAAPLADALSQLLTVIELAPPVTSRDLLTKQAAAAKVVLDAYRKTVGWLKDAEGGTNQINPDLLQSGEAQDKQPEVTRH